jgi:hypothetical protein
MLARRFGIGLVAIVVVVATNPFCLTTDITAPRIMYVILNSSLPHVGADSCYSKARGDENQHFHFDNGPIVFLLGFG